MAIKIWNKVPNSVLTLRLIFDLAEPPNQVRTHLSLFSLGF